MPLSFRASRQTGRLPGEARRGGVPGFTLLEAMVVVGVVGVVTALGFGALTSLQRRSAFASATTELLTALRQCRTEAYGRGAPTVFVLDSIGRRWWAIVDSNSDFRLESFRPFSPAPRNTAPAPNDLLLGSGTLAAGVTVGPPDGFGEALPAPFEGSPASSACTFCRAGGANAGYGALVFLSSGGVRLSDGSLNGGSITLAPPQDLGRRPVTLALNARTGVVRLFERAR
jgi:type II secretory pathway pseudopilin PulG